YHPTTRPCHLLPRILRTLSPIRNVLCVSGHAWCNPSSGLTAGVSSLVITAPAPGHRLASIVRAAFHAQPNLWHSPRMWLLPVCSFGSSLRVRPNPSLHPKCYSGLRPLPHSGELKR